MPQLDRLSACPRCSEPLEAADRFCGACGAEVTAAARQTEPQQTGVQAGQGTAGPAAAGADASAPGSAAAGATGDVDETPSHPPTLPGNHSLGGTPVPPPGPPLAPPPPPPAPPANQGPRKQRGAASVPPMPSSPPATPAPPRSPAAPPAQPSAPATASAPVPTPTEPDFTLPPAARSSVREEPGARNGQAPSVPGAPQQPPCTEAERSPAPAPARPGVPDPRTMLDDSPAPRPPSDAPAAASPPGTVPDPSTAGPGSGEGGYDSAIRALIDDDAFASRARFDPPVPASRAAWEAAHEGAPQAGGPQDAPETGESGGGEAQQDDGPEELTPRCVACGTGAIDHDGYCEHCGHKQPRDRDHMEGVLQSVAAASDRGLRHHRNEDFFTVIESATAEGAPATIVIVCDGVSSATRPDDASAAASEAAGAALRDSVPSGRPARQAMHDALLAAAEAVTALAAEGPNEPSKNAPACTIVAALTAGGILTVGWIGDSRAYWVPEDRTAPPARLTEDDSWAAQMVAAGLMTEAEAYADARAHAITGWLGADAYEVEPHTAAFRPEGPGTVVVCTDGLWNYAESAEEMAAALPHDARTRPLHSARYLVGYALDGGGHDNVTVAVVPFSVPEEPPATQPGATAAQEGRVPPAPPA